MNKRSDMMSETIHREEKKKELTKNILIIGGVIVLASILGAISGKLLLDHII